MKFITFLLCMLFSVASYAKLKINDFKGAKIYLNTAPAWCPPCNELEKSLQKSGEPNKIKVMVEGVELNLEIIRLDHSTPDPKVEKEAKNLGFSDSVPFFKIFSSNGEDLSQKELSPITVNFASLPEVTDSDTIESYNQRIGNNLITKEGFEKSIKSHIKDLIGIQDVLTSNNQNPEFSPFACKTNVMIAGTAQSPFDNAAFTGLSIKSISQKLDSIFAPFPTILYGSGKSKSRDSMISKNDKQQFVKIAGVNAQATFTRENLASFFNATNTAEAKNNLLVFVGHGAPKGSLMWGQDPLKPSELSSLTKESKSQNVLVSGNCFGGVMAKSVSCGFIGATPHVPASGCWEDVETGKNIEDYTKVYFRALEDDKADINGDGKVSFSEAHIYAIIHGEKVDTPYSTTDALVEDYFKRTKAPLSKTPSLDEIRTLVQSYGNEEEKHLLESLAPRIFDNSIRILNEGEPQKTSVTIKHEGKEYEFQIEEDRFYYSNTETKTDKGIFLAYMEIDEQSNLKIDWIDNENNIHISDVYYSDSNNYRSYAYKLKLNENGDLEGEILFDSDDTSKMGNFEFISKLKDNKDIQSYIKTLNDRMSTPMATSLDHGNLYQLYKRMMYKAQVENNKDENEKLSKIRACETQNISEFLNP